MLSGINTRPTSTEAVYEVEPGRDRGYQIAVALPGDRVLLLSSACKGTARQDECHPLALDQLISAGVQLRARL